jgi:biotin transport system substrate-specific component
MIMDTVLRKEIVQSKSMIKLMGALFCLIMIALSAYVRIPLPGTPVPVTLQTFFVLLSGAVLGMRWGAGTLAAYSALGALGFSLFTGTGSGMLYVLGPTGGYLAGFVVAALITGFILPRIGNNFLSVFCVMLVADMAILACGSAWLGVLTRQSFPIVISMGVMPFIAGDILKAYAAAAVYLKLKSRIEQLFY